MHSRAGMVRIKLGIMKTIEENGGQRIRTKRSRRIITAKTKRRRK